MEKNIWNVLFGCLPCQWTEALSNSWVLGGNIVQGMKQLIHYDGYVRDKPVITSTSFSNISFFKLSEEDILDFKGEVILE